MFRTKTVSRSVAWSDGCGGLGGGGVGSGGGGGGGVNTPHVRLPLAVVSITICVHPCTVYIWQSVRERCV